MQQLLFIATAGDNFHNIFMLQLVGEIRIEVGAALNMIKYPVAIWTIPFKHLTQTQCTLTKKRKKTEHNGHSR